MSVNVFLGPWLERESERKREEMQLVGQPVKQREMHCSQCCLMSWPVTQSLRWQTLGLKPLRPTPLFCHTPFPQTPTPSPPTPSSSRDRAVGSTRVRLNVTSSQHSPGAV
ncbi:hypothetical protein JZ751_017530 [Albula glossodonta]|uniref:Uncharacterized protein n=1 Tax=Albula glossodonta TaxID=121402 RepID=A0A8T2PK47_9TELE|nr:hypothetical protein JZ751_017530 [Albula glossodonta]